MIQIYPSSTGTYWKFRAYKLQSKRCTFYLNEKLEMLEDRENNLLNKKSEVILKSRHQKKYMFTTIVSKIQYHGITEKNTVTSHGNKDTFTPKFLTLEH